MCMFWYSWLFLFLWFLFLVLCLTLTLGLAGSLVDRACQCTGSCLSCWSTFCLRHTEFFAPSIRQHLNTEVRQYPVLDKMTTTASLLSDLFLFFFTLACFSIGHEAISVGTQTLVASWCVYALMLAHVSLLTLIDIYRYKKMTFTWRSRFTTMYNIQYTANADC